MGALFSQSEFGEARDGHLYMGDMGDMGGGYGD